MPNTQAQELGYKSFINFFSKPVWITFQQLWQLVESLCQRSKLPTLEVRNWLQKHSFKTIRFPQEVPWTRSKQFWALYRKCFAQGLNFIVNWKFFQTILLHKVYNPGHVEWNFNSRAAKLSQKSEVFFCSSPEHILEVNKSRLSLEMFLCNHGVLFWKYQQKFPPKIWHFSWMIKKKKLYTFFKSFLKKLLWMRSKQFWNCAENICQKSKVSSIKVRI